MLTAIGYCQINVSPNLTKWIVIINLLPMQTENNKLAEKMVYPQNMVYRKHEVQKFVHHIRISTINVSSVMLGIETVFGRPYNLPQFRINY